jgi:calcineurin-like phosphoesterase family protein
MLIMGNHDRGRPSFYRDCGFKIVRPFAITYQTPHGQDNVSVSFSHYPWNDDDEGRAMIDSEVRIHGHIHNNGYFDGRNHPLGNVLIPFLANHINVSVEQTRYRPVNLGLLLDAAILGRLPS